MSHLKTIEIMGLLESRLKKKLVVGTRGLIDKPLSCDNWETRQCLHVYQIYRNNKQIPFLNNIFIKSFKELSFFSIFAKFIEIYFNNTITIS